MHRMSHTSKQAAALQVQVTEREQQGSIVTCRCSVVSSGITAQSVIALFRSTIALETHVGSRLTICSPWRECTVPGELWHETVKALCTCLAFFQRLLGLCIMLMSCF